MRTFLLCLVFLCTLPAGVTNIRGSFAGATNIPPYDAKTDTLGLFGAPGFPLPGDAVSIRFSYDKTDLLGVYSALGYSWTTASSSSSAEQTTITVNGVAVLYSGSDCYSIAFSSYPTNSFDYTLDSSISPYYDGIWFAIPTRQNQPFIVRDEGDPGSFSIAYRGTV